MSADTCGPPSKKVDYLHILLRELRGGSSIPLSPNSVLELLQFLIYTYIYIYMQYIYS